MRLARLIFALFFGWAFGVQAGHTQPRAQCALSLVLALDVSSSVDAGEYQLQMEGLARALESDLVVNAIIEAGGIQFLAFEWSGRFNSIDIAPWQFAADRAGIARFAAQIRGHERGYNEWPTALGYALGYASTRLGQAPLNCARKVVDVSGDGVNNEGFGPIDAYRNFDFNGVQVNGLVIAGAMPDPVDYYRRNVPHGPGAFVEVASDFADYERAMQRKLLREINGAALSMLPRDQ